MSQYYSNNGSFVNRLFGTIPPVTRNLFFVNMLFFIAARINPEFMLGTFAMFFPTSPFFHIWQPLTYMFMHYNFWHVFMNMWGLLMFGSALERTIGTNKYLILYFASGFLAVGFHIAVNALMGNPSLVIPMLGASGAIFGVQIGYAMVYPNAIWTLMFPPISLKAKWFVLIFIGIELLTGITGTTDGIAHFAHLGGALCGFLLMFWWKKTGKLWNN